MAPAGNPSSSRATRRGRRAATVPTQGHLALHITPQNGHPDDAKWPYVRLPGGERTPAAVGAMLEPEWVRLCDGHGSGVIPARHGD